MVGCFIRLRSEADRRWLHVRSHPCLRYYCLVSLRRTPEDGRVIGPENGAGPNEWLASFLDVRRPLGNSMPLNQVVFSTSSAYKLSNWND